MEKVNNYDFLTDYAKFARYCFKIKTKENMLVPFLFNSSQRKIYERIARQEASGRPTRIFILKPRQIGISTFCSGYMYFRTVTDQYTNSVVVAHDLKSTNNIFEMARRYYAFSPEDAKPMTQYSNTKELVFDNPDLNKKAEDPGLGSSIQVMTAGSRVMTGRSSTINNLHISELAYWPDAKNTLHSLVQAVPLKVGSSIIIESTANGMAGIGKHFYEIYEAIKAGESDYELVFIAWHEHDEYRIEPPSDFKLTEREEMIKRTYSLDDSQMYWRRYKIRNDFNGDEIYFRQEFPASPEEAFILSGRPLINEEKILPAIQRASAIPVRKAKLAQVLDQVKAYQHAEGDYKIFDTPTKDRIYVVGADVAEGLEDGDYSTAFVMNKEMRQVASYKAHIDPHLFAVELEKLGKYYNNAQLAVEVNNHGHAVLSKLKDLGYSNIYAREVKDERGMVLTKKLGWQTNVKTKHLMLDEFVAAFYDGSIEINDLELLREMATLQIEEDGDVSLGGMDLTVSACIATQGVKQLPMLHEYRAIHPEKEKPAILMPLAKRMEQREKKKDDWF